MDSTANRALFELVRRRLMEDQRLAGQILNVTASGGYIQITGLVDTEEDKQLALQLATGIAGVRNVEDRIKVRKTSRL